MLKLGCYFFSSWHYLKHGSICKVGQVLKTDNIYTFEADRNADIVRLPDVYKDKGYLYCTLYFFARNKIATLSQILNSDDHVIWRIMENKEFDEIMSSRLWQEFETED